MEHLEKIEPACIRKEEVHTLSHVIFKCPLTKRLPGVYQLDEFFKLDYSIITSYKNEFRKALRIKD